MISFHVLSPRFEREVSKWDESGNDIVLLAKEMYTMMMDMSDFTRYVRSTATARLKIDSC